MKALLKKHIADCIEFDGLGYDTPKDNSLECAANTLYLECIERNPNEQRKHISDAFTYALQGLPSYICVPFENYEIANLMYALGYEFDRKNDDEYFKAVDLYWKLCGQILSEAYYNNKYQLI
jgi:hypothetical protein